MRKGINALHMKMDTSRNDFFLILSLFDFVVCGLAAPHLAVKIHIP